MLNFEDLKLGSIVQCRAPLQYEGSFNEVIRYKLRTFSFYTSNPNKFVRKKLDKLRIREALVKFAAAKLTPDDIYVHAPYFINFANKYDPSRIETSIKTLIIEMRRCYKLKANNIILRLGSCVNTSRLEAIKSCADCINKTYDRIEQYIKINILIETASPKNNEVGINFDELKQILDLIDEKYRDRVKICFVTNRMYSAGYRFNDVDSILDDFDNTIGLEKLGLIILCDNRNDTHIRTNIGKGVIGFDNFISLIYNERLKGLNMIIETPNLSNIVFAYPHEIQMIKNKKFDENVFIELERQVDKNRLLN